MAAGGTMTSEGSGEDGGLHRHHEEHAPVALIVYELHPAGEQRVEHRWSSGGT
jgi:hypothetical protein